MTDQQISLQRLVDGRQYEMALRLAIGTENLSFAIDRVKAAYIMAWMERDGFAPLLTESFKALPITKMVKKSAMPAINRAFKRDLSNWGLQNEIKA